MQGSPTTSREAKEGRMGIVCAHGILSWASYQSPSKMTLASASWSVKTSTTTFLPSQDALIMKTVVLEDSFTLRSLLVFFSYVQLVVPSSCFIIFSLVNR